MSSQESEHRPTLQDALEVIRARELRVNRVVVSVEAREDKSGTRFFEIRHAYPQHVPVDQH